MNNVSSVNRAIRLNAVGGGALLVGVGASLLLIGTGVFHWEAGMGLLLAMGAASGGWALLTAWSLRRDRDDPAGIEGRERRVESFAVVWGVVLLLVAFVAVGGIIVWGLTR